jgi:hypothetical protein
MDGSRRILQETIADLVPKDLLFPPDKQVQLDVNYLKKMGLTRKRMLECDALFFY